MEVRRTRHLVNLICMMLVTQVQSQKQSYVPGLFVFGDSLNDNGNNNFLPCVVKYNSRHQLFTIQILLEQLIFLFFLRVHVYLLFLIHCVLSWDFGKESCYSMDSKSLFTSKKCLRPIQKHGASWCFNEWLQGMDIFILPYFFTDDFYAEKVQCLWLGFYHCMDIFILPYFFKMIFMLKSAIPRIGFLGFYYNEL